MAASSTMTIADTLNPDKCISTAGGVGAGDESPACQEQKLAFVINQFDRAVTEQSLPASGASTPSTSPALRMQQSRRWHTVAQQAGAETRKWSANGVGLVDKRMSVTSQSTEMRRLKV